MHAGRERNIIRWEIHHERLRRELAEVNAALAELARSGGPEEPHAREHLNQLRQRCDDLQRQLQELGPSPSAKMG